MKDLTCLFRPRSIAVIGASRRRGTISGEVFHNLVTRGFPGPVFPVNPNAAVVQSVRAWPSISDVPDPVDLAVLCVPRDQVLAAVDACAQKGVRGLVVLSAGFAETGPEGRALQDELLARVRAHGMRMVGPNCLGLLNTDPAVLLDATFAPRWPPAGNVAFSSQSGGLGLAIIDQARDLGIGISEFVSVGNKADVSGNDLLEHWEQDERTRVVLLYLESFGNPRRFLEIARRVSRRKPIVAVKAGRTEAGARAASSHTGALAGSDVAVDALLGQAGVIRTDTMEELFHVGALLANQPPPRGNRIAILTNAGGPAIMASDACETHGLAVQPLAEATGAALRAFLPAAASVRNPVDMIASAPASAYERALAVLLADDAVDAVLVLFVHPLVTAASDVAAAIQRASSGSTKTVAACFLGPRTAPRDTAPPAGSVPMYAFPEPAVIALARAARYGSWLRRPVAAAVELRVDTARAKRAIEGADVSPDGWLPPAAVAEVLAAYGIRTCASAVAADEAGAIAAAERVGYPVALKLLAPTIVHKTEVGGVALRLRNASELRAALQRMRERLRELGRLAEMRGVLVQAMVEDGVETIVGVTASGEFGPLIGFGVGGVHVEVFRDVVFRLPPIDATDAREMLDQIRGAPLLAGVRGALPRDRDALVDVLLRTSRLAIDLPAIAELDLNPLMALPAGHGAVAVDARIRVASRTGGRRGP
ncbi:MAG TPA: acetate--CoA ligase family protein [Planctomycetota bacterium]